MCNNIRKEGDQTQFARSLSMVIQFENPALKKENGAKLQKGKFIQRIMNSLN
jgi:hypothetical protein